MQKESIYALIETIYFESGQVMKEICYLITYDKHEANIYKNSFSIDKQLRMRIKGYVGLPLHLNVSRI